MALIVLPSHAIYVIVLGPQGGPSSTQSTCTFKMPAYLTARRMVHECVRFAGYFGQH